MAEGKLLKYRVIAAYTEHELQVKMNLLADEGYTLHQFTAHIEQEFKTAFYAVMKLGENDYSNVTQIKDIVPELADDAINSGWEPVSMSLSTKFIRFVKRR